MKTRIKVIECNNGDKKYICQKFYMSARHLFLLNPLLILYRSSYFPFWITMKKWERLKTDYTDAIFDTMDEAKNFIDSEILKIELENKIKEGTKVKNKTIIKYP